MTRLKSLIFGNLAVTFGVVCLGLIIVAALMFAGQCFVWLKHGYWEPYPLSSLLTDLGLGWPRAVRDQTLQEMINFALSCSAALCLAVAASLCFLTGKLLADLAGYYESKIR